MGKDKGREETALRCGPGLVILGADASGGDICASMNGRADCAGHKIGVVRPKRFR